MKVSRKESTWFRHGFWNTLEHAITRVADAGSTFVLIWALSPELFSKLALAQALITPVLFFSVCPETAIYRYYSAWMEQGPDILASRIRAFRFFAVAKVPVALALATAFAFWFHGQGDARLRFYALIWAFSLALGPQIMGIDREFLRLNLNMRELSALSLFQKASFFLGTWAAALFFPGRAGFLAAAAVFSVATACWLARIRVNKVLYTLGARRSYLFGNAGVPLGRTLKESFMGFSLAAHLTGVVSNFIQTMDLFFLGVFRYPARQVGLYAAVLKLSNFSLALPTAFSNIFQIWTGRRTQEKGHRKEKRRLLQFTLILALFSLIQGFLLYLGAPWLFRLVARGRWDAVDLAHVQSWLPWILGSTVLFGISIPSSAWLSLRSKTIRFFAAVYVPWCLVSLIVYVILVRTHGPMGAAVGNAAVVGLYFVMITAYSRIYRPTR